MTIDARIEALTQSVELLASFHRDNEERMAKLMDAMTSLVTVVKDHERRIDGSRAALNSIAQRLTPAPLSPMFVLYGAPALPLRAW